MTTNPPPDLTGVDIDRVANELIPWLESGEHAKTTQVLCRVETDYSNGVTIRKYCCLGGASEVAIAGGVPIVRRQDNSENEQIIVYDGNETTLCPAAREYFGFNIDDPLIQDYTGIWRNATGWNDYGEDRQGPEPDFTKIAEGFRRLIEEAKRQQGVTDGP